MAAPARCTITIGPDVETLDGAERGLEPGAVICLPAGTRGNLKIANVNGTAGSPITIRNDGGTVVITGTRFESGIHVLASSHLRITGTGMAERCGAPHDTDGQDCGIVVDGARKGLKVATSRGDAGDLEIDHIAIRRVEADVETRGIAIHPVDRQTVSGISIHHNHIIETGAEAIYVGSEPRQKSFDDLGKVARVEIAHNLIEEIGWDAIKLKVAIADSTVHHNVIRNVGLANYKAHRAGVTIASSRMVAVHDNLIMGTPEGIRTGRPLDDAWNRYHDNVIVDTTLVALEVREAAEIANNTIVRAAGVGIHARGAGTRVVDNIVADAAEPLDVRSAVMRGNLVGAAGEIGFVDPAAGDFRLTIGSPAVHGGRVVDPTLCNPGMRSKRPVRFALATHTRPDRPACRVDLGARAALVGMP